MLARYYVTGWSPMLKCWMHETFEAKTTTAAKQRFTARYPTLKTIKVYQL